ncbi:MAG: nicotinamidase [Betaproteobacteria bacterium]|nr:nicotinamidase [Betaproteobacteria bacterium]
MAKMATISLADVIWPQACLVVTDVQVDFLPGGALPVPEGNQLLPVVRALMESERFGLLVATQDWHPPDHVSFASSHPGRLAYDVVDLYGHSQVLWPDHCVQGSSGARLHPYLPWVRCAAIIRKGMDRSVDSYSTFRNNWDASGHRASTGLVEYLRGRGVLDVFLCGLTREFCVKWSAEDAAQAGFRVWVVWDATRALDPTTDQGIATALKGLGVGIVRFAELQAAAG